MPRGTAPRGISFNMGIRYLLRAELLYQRMGECIAFVKAVLGQDPVGDAQPHGLPLRRLCQYPAHRLLAVRHALPAHAARSSSP